MFLGEYRHTIDDKGRLTIPAKYRGLLAAGMVVTRGFDRNLMAFSMEGWEELATRVKSLPWSDPSAREFRRRVFSGAIDLVPDRQGRVLLPPYLREFANIDSDVVITGMLDHLEIWNSDAWEPVREAAESDEQHWENLGI
ncbi:MAG TPA: division/cell wall cluster transcriptional repressor MraZ [Promineifilum sp.]|nr:division/cell wall cluster transcriptional repressor MraZ [Promineifilum sp.]HRO89763.1 division/cell wall cluster transcriptional repressor MraZ [Promineifilum sp.]HRQ12390.1 division/cell wall cluster transcriptional repressor MraZ [Promineifilum sp.]